ncbi:MAG: methyltransferase domain-containing protein [Rhodovibrionaceae bacterium]
MSQARQSWDPQRYQDNAAFVAKLGEPLLDLLQPRSGERILDLGCGDGVLTEKLAASGAKVLGIDFSAAQIAGARERGLEAQVGSGEDLRFSAEFDAVFSNAALHWMLRPDLVIDGVWRALKPGGRFVAEMGGAGNVQSIRAALIAALDRRGYDGQDAVPWYFPSPQEYRGKLEKQGFAVPYIELIPRPTPLPGDISGWLATFGESFVNRLPEEERPALIAEVTEVLATNLRDAEGNWTADYVRLRFRAEKPAV